MNCADPIEVLTLADQRYAIPLAVAVRSLLDSLEPNRKVNLTIIDGGICAEVKQKLLDSWRTSAGWPRSSVEWRAPDYGAAASLPEWGRVPNLTYARINLATYLTPEKTRAIVLDSDVLVRCGIGRLWGTRLDGAIAAAPIDPFIPTVSSAGGLARPEHGLPPEAPYLNAGVLLVDLELWRQGDIGQRAIAFLVENWQAADFYDQDALNAVLAGRWKALDARWQTQPRRANLLGDAAAGPHNDAWIFHFSGRLKPWRYRGTSPADREFFEVLDRTVWSGWRPPVTLRSTLIGLYERRLRRRLHPYEARVLGWLGRMSRLRGTLARRLVRLRDR